MLLLLLPMLMLLLLLVLDVVVMLNVLANVQPLIDVFRRLFVTARLLLLSNAQSLLLNFNAALDMVAGFVDNAVDIVMS